VKYESAAATIGDTPLIRLQIEAPEGVEVYAKLELANPFGMKDRVALSVIGEARSAGILSPGAPIVESSSGTMALGLALVGRSMGHPVHIVTDPRIDVITLTKLRTLGAEVHIVESMDKHGWQGARLTRLAQLMDGLERPFWPRQYTNPANPRAYRHLATELVNDLGSIDVIVGSVGSGGSLSGTARALRQVLPRLRTVAVDCVGSSLFDQPDRPYRLQSGLGNSLRPNTLDRTLIDKIHWLNDREAFTATLDLVREQQVFAGNTSGSVYRVLCEEARHASPGERLVGIFPDRGDRYVDTVYAEPHWTQHGLEALPLRRVPTEVTYGTKVAAWSYARMPVTDEPQRLLFLESNTTGTGMTAITTARNLGFRPVFLTADPERYSGLAETGCEVVVCDTGSLSDLRETVQRQFPREELAGVTTTYDFYVESAAVLADWLDLPGNPVEVTRICRNKSEARALLLAGGVPQPRFRHVDSVHEVAEAVAHTGLPCVVKPVDGSGSQYVGLCRTLDDAVDLVRRIAAVEVNVRGLPVAPGALIEQFVSGQEYSVEVVTVDGVSTCVGVTAKRVAGKPWFVECGHLHPAALSSADTAALTECAVAALKALGWETGPTHVEIKLTGKGPVVIEVNPRPAGGMIPELVRLSTGIDLVEAQLLAAVGREPDLAPKPRGVAGIAFLMPERAGRLAAVHGRRDALTVPGLRTVAVTAVPGAQVSPPQDAYGRIGYMIATGTTATEVSTALAKAGSLLTIDIEENES
jgi:S-sulfo-L-cysteine synthase (3-phospho-L-serine-dependent)